MDNFKAVYKILTAFDYVSRKLGYDGFPQVVDTVSFEKLAESSPVGIVYRGITADSRLKALKYADEFKNGRMYAGKSYNYGHGTYFSRDKDEAEKYNNQGVMIRAALSSDTKIADYREILKEYSATGADTASHKKGNNTEAWEDILSSISEYASIKGYDVLDMARMPGPKHIIVLNRKKVIVESSEEK